VIGTCLECNRIFEAPASRFREGKKFCSQLCRRLYWAATPDKFWTYVNKTETCWLWMGSRTSEDGYGQYEFTGGVRVLAHIYSYEQVYGPVPKGKILLHSCDSQPCINPDHLSPGSYRDNTQDALSKGRMAFGERVGCSKLTDKDVLNIRTLYKGGWTQKRIAPFYNISAHQIGRVVSGKNWGHVTGVQ
jgi:hypothetical protein